MKARTSPRGGSDGSLNLADVDGPGMPIANPMSLNAMPAADPELAGPMQKPATGVRHLVLLMLAAVYILGGLCWLLVNPDTRTSGCVGEK